jgi:hypothetical protein
MPMDKVTFDALTTGNSAGHQRITLKVGFVSSSSVYHDLKRFCTIKSFGNQKSVESLIFSLIHTCIIFSIQVTADLFVAKKVKAYVLLTNGPNCKQEIVYNDPEFQVKIQPAIEFYKRHLLPIKLQPKHK